MNWVTSNLLILVVGGVLLLFGSFVRGQIRVTKPNWILFGVGIILLVCFGFGVVQVLNSSPGNEETEIVILEINDGFELPDSAILRLQMDWDSEKREADWGVSETLAEISEIAYMAPVSATKRFNEIGFSEVMPLVSGSMMGYALRDQGTTVIVFRGTNSSETSDWISNVNRFGIDTPDGRIHAGFNTAYYLMEPQVNEFMQGRDVSNIWVTGHSLGGALALICAYDLMGSGIKIDGVITFGQPMVADEKLANHIDSLLIGRYVRYVNGDDLVPRIPPSYFPCGSLVWFTKDGLRRSAPKRNLTDSAAGSSMPVEQYEEIIPLTEIEFEQIQSLYAESKKPIIIDGREAYLTRSTLIEDHSMKEYIFKIRLHLKNFRH